ncbi:MAG TPA: CAP domain-containing protein [Crinalium sp.]|jgi:uncharacterized protein YkwD
MVRDTGANTLNLASPIQCGIIRNDTVGTTDPNDFFSFKLGARSRFNLKLNGLIANADVELCQDRNGNGSLDLGEVVASSRATGAKGETMSLVGLDKGTYYLRVFAKEDSTTPYNLFFNATPTKTISPTYEVVLRTNEFRVKNGLQPLAVNTQLTRAAQKYAREMALQDNFSHTGKDGSSPWDRMRAADYDFSEAAENLAAGHTSAASAIQGWQRSPGHRKNMLAYQVQEIGVGYYYLKSDGGKFTYQRYWSQPMATPADVHVQPQNLWNQIEYRDPNNRFPRFPD